MSIRSNTPLYALLALAVGVAAWSLGPRDVAAEAGQATTQPASASQEWVAGGIAPQKLVQPSSASEWFTPLPKLDATDTVRPAAAPADRPAATERPGVIQQVTHLQSPHGTPAGYPAANAPAPAPPRVAPTAITPQQPTARYPLAELLASEKFSEAVAKLPPVASVIAPANGPPQTNQHGLSAEAVAHLSAADLATLQDLPPMCTSELPGLDLSQVVPARDRLPTRLVAQASATQPLAPDAHTSLPPAAHVAAVSNPHSPDFLKADVQQFRADQVAAGKDPDGDPHLEIYSQSAFPSAKDCATCHKQLYEEWSTSSHAYAAISPMFHKFENKINRLAQGTLGYFCLRCHAPVATTMGLRRDQPIWDGPRVFREGVTCVACHRVNTPYTKADGERRIEPGGLHEPVYGASDGTGGEIAHKYSDFFKVTSDPKSKKQGQLMHRRAIQFEELSESTFCMSCHQVAVKPGIKLEVVWDQYRASPACREGISCQDCHMGKVPGVDSGYSVGPGAVVNDKVVNAERKHANHTFYGPGYSIAHPGIFPDNLKADRWTVNEWLQFDWRGGWGSEAYEKALDEGQFHTTFPPVWAEADDRLDAREIVDENLKKLAYKRDLRRQVLENGSKLDGPFFFDTPALGEPLKFRYCLTNISNGHNMPSGSLGAQPQLWMNVVLIGPNGQRLWETGYVDSNGDLCDNHSLDVLSRDAPMDTQLFNLQTKFLTTNVKGTDREMYLPINVDFDQLPFIRPASVPITVLNHPPFIRMEGHSIPALGSRNAKFVVPSRLMCEPGVYRMSVRMRSRAEPIYFMRFCDATPEMERMMNEWIADFHTSTVTFEVR